MVLPGISSRNLTWMNVCLSCQHSIVKLTPNQYVTLGKFKKRATHPRSVLVRLTRAVQL